MSKKFPEQVRLEPHEIDAINRINMARFYGVIPSDIDRMTEEDYRTTLDIMWAEGQK